MDDGSESASTCYTPCAIFDAIAEGGRFSEKSCSLRRMRVRNMIKNVNFPIFLLMREAHQVLQDDRVAAG